MSIYSKLAKISSKVIKKFGVKVTFTQKLISNFDPEAGSGTETTSTFTGYGVKDKYTKDEVNGQNVLFSDIKFLFEKVSTVPVIGDTCTIGSIIYRVMDVTPIDPADETVIYILQLRK